MGEEICTCLNNLTGFDSEDLSREGNENDNNKNNKNDNNNKSKKKPNKKPKVVLDRKDSLDSSERLQTQKGKETISTNLNSEYKNTISNQNNQNQSQIKQENLKKKNQKSKNDISNNDKNINDNNRNSNIESIKNNYDINNTNILESNNKNNNYNNIGDNNNKNNTNNNKNMESNNNKRNINANKSKKSNSNSNKNSTKEINYKNENNNIDLNKMLNRDQMVSENFNKFFNSQNGQEMILNMNDTKNKICITLHKYFVSLITRREYKKNIKFFQDERNTLYQKSLDIIYNSNPNLKKLEKVSPIKYTKDGYKKYYPEIKDQEKMIFEPKKDSFDNCIIISYEEEDSSSLEKIQWLYKGQVNKVGFPHGFGEKIFKAGKKMVGYFKDGEIYGWGMIILKGEIFIGPFYDGKGVTGKGEKFTLKKRAIYKGDFIDGEKSGKGEEDSNEGNFLGNFYHDKKNGKGKMIYKLTGDIYEGDYKNDLFDGKGNYIWKATGQKYSGDYKNGLMHGNGLLEYSEGEYYKGEFVNGLKEGQGELHMSGGRSYVGPFANGRPNGIGIFDNGINFKGEIEFIDGKININYMKQKYFNTNDENINVIDINEQTDKDKENENNNDIDNKEQPQVIKE